MSDTEQQFTRSVQTVGGYIRQSYPDPKFCLETNNPKVLKALDKMRNDHGSDYRRLGEKL